MASACLSVCLSVCPPSWLSGGSAGVCRKGSCSLATKPWEALDGFDCGRGNGYFVDCLSQSVSTRQWPANNVLAKTPFLKKRNRKE